VQNESVDGSYKTAERKWRNLLAFGDGSPDSVAHKVGGLRTEIVTPANHKQMQPNPVLLVKIVSSLELRTLLDALAIVPPSTATNSSLP
jgi:hypothetical protein